MVNIIDVLAPKFDEKSQYAKNKFVIHDNKMYIANRAIAPGPFDSDEWTETYMVNLFNSSPFIVTGTCYYLGKITGVKARDNGSASRHDSTYLDTLHITNWTLNTTKEFDLSSVVPDGVTPTVILANPATDTGYMHVYCNWESTRGWSTQTAVSSNTNNSSSWDSATKTLTVTNTSSSEHISGEANIQGTLAYDIDKTTDTYSDICVLIVI